MSRPSFGGFFDYPTLQTKLRQIGFLDPLDTELTQRLAQLIPGASDLVRFMLKDVEDQRIVRDFFLDAEFPDKFKGKVEQWAKNQGLSREVMLYEWRAHWQNMPFTQLQEMMFRLRPDKYGQAKDINGFPIAVTADTVYEALGQNDVPPFWRRKLIEISYHKMRQVDARRGYENNSISRDQLKSLYLDNGFSPDTVELLLSVADRSKRKSLRNSQWVKLYKSNGINDATARVELTREGFGAGEIDEALRWADTTADADVMRRCVAQTKDRYNRGEISELALPGQLQQVGLSPRQVARLVQSMRCTRDTRSKDLTGAQICDLHSRGLLSENEAYDRYRRIGYSEADARRVLKVCDDKASDRAAKAAAAAAKRAAAETKKAASKKPAAQGNGRK